MLGTWSEVNFLDEKRRNNYFFELQLKKMQLKIFNCILIIFFCCCPLFNIRLTLFLHRPIHGIMRKRFFLIFQTTNRSSNSPHQNNGYNSHNISKFDMMPSYKHSIYIGWNNGYWMLQLIDF